MGMFRVEVEIANPRGGEFTPVELVVDTGAYYTTLPASLLESLGLTPNREMRFRIADGSAQTWGVASALFRVDGIETYSPVAFGPEGVFLLGAVTLEELALIADTTNRRLVPAEEVPAVGVRLAGSGP
ncbi:MAG: hypothetical protein F4052_02580 [Dehalococcoidia bacterium]|nr:hypothetical protein [Dehalococcoidia bacterium]